MRLLLADNGGGFSRSLAHLAAQVLDVVPESVAYADLSAERARDCDLLFIATGPGHPRDYPAYAPLFAQGNPADDSARHAGPAILGIGLGMLIVNHCLGGETAALATPAQGRAETVGFGPERLRVARYQSLYASRLAPGLAVTAATDGGVPMAVRHESLPLAGLAFQVESFLTEKPEELLRHALAGLLHP
ncbi:Glutamine amidotransferase type 1 [Desulfovibrio sp. X2]|uniref:glutamine amidotransferase-related protein n=1 Tax=Desulfovibrio sp. X2 TaxID=941449 RepID=UPI000358A0B9|nr:glutamine amidotransferase [Desulfovibrio sp. X2]EPR43995.1 Glutamine amidotransferase type 1 [Desulfovibrio sp. X2]